MLADTGPWWGHRETETEMKTDTGHSPMQCEGTEGETYWEMDRQDSGDFALSGYHMHMFIGWWKEQAKRAKLEKGAKVWFRALSFCVCYEVKKGEEDGRDFF